MKRSLDLLVIGLLYKSAPITEGTPACRDASSDPIPKCGDGFRGNCPQICLGAGLGSSRSGIRPGLDGLPPCRRLGASTPRSDLTRPMR